MVAVAIVAGIIPAFVLGGLLAATAYLNAAWRLIHRPATPEEL